MPEITIQWPNDIDGRSNGRLNRCYSILVAQGQYMEDIDLQQDFEKLTVQHLVLRDIVVRMLSYQAIDRPDSKAFLTNFSEAGIRRAYMLAHDGRTHGELAAIAAEEVDWVTSAALSLVTISGLACGSAEGHSG
jgi:hypothetical protein